MRLIPIVALIAFTSCECCGDTLRVFDRGQVPADSRLGELRTIKSEFPFRKVRNAKQWDARREQIRRRVLISQGLWPQPAKSELDAVVHSRQDLGDYTIEAVYFQSLPNHFVTGSLYRPKNQSQPCPAILCPHGHWQDARFYDAGEEKARLSIASGGERFMSAARNHIQARCVQLARMGCVAFLYDTTGNSDSIQLGHRPDTRENLDSKTDWLYFSEQADLRLQNMMGLQTWNSVRSIDFVSELPDVDPNRIGVTGASGGGTQSMILAAIDERITAAMPCVMVSTAMQGGCTCENAPLLRIDQGNVDIAACVAPRPLGLTAADDWTVELQTQGYPELKSLYSMLGQKDRLTAAFNTHFKHNYNHVNRTVMYGFFNRHFGLGLEEPILEKDFERLTKEHLTVWNQVHPAPSGDRVGDKHEIEVLSWLTNDSDTQIAALVPRDSQQLVPYRNVVGHAWKTILGRRVEDVGELNFTLTETREIGDAIVDLGRLDHVPAKEQLPVAVMRAKVAADTKFGEHGVVIWLGDDGKSSCLSDSELDPAVSDLLLHGYTVVSADLIGQGEFTADAHSFDEQRMWYQRNGQNAWERSAAYTYGYNHSLFVQRAHDVLSLVKFSKTSAKDGAVHLVASGPTAGPIALAARSQAGDFITKTVIDLDGFRFADVQTHASPMFVPGAVKYLDVSGLLSLCAPYPVSIAGLSDLSVARAVYSASGSLSALETNPHKAVRAWLTQQAPH